jgi:signal transduction histidine kinase
VNLFKKFEGTGVRKANVVANLGLGLYFCRLAVEAHGGSIKIEQSEKWPVSFEITMPKSASQIK